MDDRDNRHGLTQWHSTTIIGVKRGDTTVIAGDGQVSMGNTVMKPNARKVRRIGEGGKVVAGFAGATADAFTLFERLEKKLEQHNGQLLRAAVELTGDTSSWDAVADSGNVKTHAFCPRCGSPVHLTFSAMPDVPSSASSFRSFWLLPCPSWGQVSFRASSPVGV